MKNRQLIFIVVFVLAFVGCSSAGYFQANHNGRYYWNPGNCDAFEYYNDDSSGAIYCMTDNQRNGIVLYPASNEEVMLYNQQQAIAAQQFQQSLNQLSQTMNNALIQQQSSYNQLQQMNHNMHIQNIDRSLQGINNSLNRMSNPYWYGY